MADGFVELFLGFDGVTEPQVLFPEVQIVTILVHDLVPELNDALHNYE